MKMKIYIVYLEHEKWNDDIEFIIIRAKTRKQVKQIIYHSEKTIFWNNRQYQKIKSIRILGFSLKNKKAGIITYADLSDG